MSQNQNDPAKQNNLALARTIFAAERTLLAYWRTALGFAGAGVLVIKFFPSSAAFVAGGGLEAFALILFFYGMKKYASIRRRLEK